MSQGALQSAVKEREKKKQRLTKNLALSLHLLVMIAFNARDWFSLTD